MRDLVLPRLAPACPASVQLIALPNVPLTIGFPASTCSLTYLRCAVSRRQNKLQRVEDENARQVRFSCSGICCAVKVGMEPGASSVLLQTVFTKTKTGLLRRAMELSLLCDCQIGLIVFGPDGALTQYCSADLEQVLRRYADVCQEPHECRTNQDVRICLVQVVRSVP